MSVTYYVALPFVRTEEGDLAPGEAKECPSALSAEREAYRLSVQYAGAVAFSRTGDPSTGEFSDAVVFRSYGEVLSLEQLLGV